MARTTRLGRNRGARSARTVMIAVCVAAAAGGCGHVSRLADAGMTGNGGDGGGGGGGDAGLPADATPPDAGSPCSGNTIALSDIGTCAVRAFCTTLVRCQGQYDSIDQCVQNGAGGFASFLQNNFKQYQAAIAAGKIQYDGSAAAGCFAALASESCTQDPGNDPACSGVFSGSSTDAQPCIFGEECGVGGECQGGGSIDQDTCTMGTCVTAAQIGQSCNMRPCVPNALCVADSGGGATCRSGKTGSPCMTDNDCGAAFWCNGTSMQCAADLGDGGTCVTDSQCASPDLCVNGTCGAVDKPGDSCQGTCYDGLYCNIPMGANVGSCAALPGLNQSCAQSGQCNHFDLFCNSNQICAQRPQAGESCQTGQCMPGLFCTAALGASPGTCAQPLANGNTCTQAAQCQSGNCAIPMGGTGTCQAYMVCY